MTKRSSTRKPSPPKQASALAKRPARYEAVLADVIDLLESARRASARAVNTIMTATYWHIGHRIVEHEQSCADQAGYGQAVLERLSEDLTTRFGRGFSIDHLELMRLFHQTYSPRQISESLIRNSSPSPQASPKSEALIRKSSFVDIHDLAHAFPLSWTHYVHLLRRCRSAEARQFYETEALRGGWSVRWCENPFSHALPRESLPAIPLCVLRASA